VKRALLFLLLIAIGVRPALAQKQKLPEGIWQGYDGEWLHVSQQLIARWPMLLPGFHRLELDGGRVVLTLLFGEAAQLLPQCVATADAIYLDGFAPTKNPEMWSPAVLSALAKLSRNGTTVATWSVSPPVLEGLANAGFDVEKTRGFIGKHHMLVGEFRGQADHAQPEQVSTPQTALVIGAGLAGTGITERLAARGWHITLIDAQDSPAQGASGNFAGAFRPQPSRDDNLMARVTRAGFSYKLRDLASLAEHGNAARWSQCGVLHLARDAVQAGKQMQTVESQRPPEDFMQWLEAENASQISGRPCTYGGWWFPQGGWISPPSLCAAHLAQAAQYPRAHIETRFNNRVARIEFIDQQWHALNENDERIASAAHLILANAHDAHRLLGKEWLPLYSARGQVSHIPAEQFIPLDTVICVEACSGSSGQTACASRAAPRSCTRIASAPARAIAARACSATGSSRSNTSVLKVTNPFTPLRWRKSNRRGSSSTPKLSARARALKPPRSPK